METILNKESRVAIELMVADGIITKDTAERYFPELKESEDERTRKWLIRTLKSLNNSPVQIDGAYEMMLPAIAYLEKQGKHKPIERSEEDEEMRYKAAAVLNKLCASNEEFVWSHNTLVNVFNWLKSLKDRVQPTQEWGEEDKNRINRLIAYFEDKESFTAEDDIVYANWLKSLRPQKQWKPSDEQMERLKGTINSLPHQEVLYSLYQDLKKLKG